MDVLPAVVIVLVLSVILISTLASRNLERAGEVRATDRAACEARGGALVLDTSGRAVCVAVLGEK